MAGGSQLDFSLAPPSADAAARAPAQPADSEAGGVAARATRKDDVRDCAACADGDNAYQRMWSAPPAREVPHGFAGVVVHKLGVFGYMLFAVIPVVFVAVVYAIIPMGGLARAAFEDVWVFALVTNTLVTVTFAFLYTAAFLSAADRERPFRQHLMPLVMSVLAQVAIVLPLLMTVGLFNYLGIASFVIFLLVLYVALKLCYREQSAACDTFFRRFVLLIALYIPILVAYIIGFRESGSLLQTCLNFSMAFVTFIYRRVMLSRLDPFPIDIAQLFAGLWVQNMYDTVTVSVLRRSMCFRAVLVILFSQTAVAQRTDHFCKL